MFPTILIVDDETTILQSLSGILSDEGFDTLTASNGYEALKIIEGESPDLVLLDIWMPGMDGIETLQEIKRTNPFIPVVIISGHGTIETAVKATKLGAYDFVEKPLSIEKVIVTINNALNFRRLEEENRFLRKKTLEKHSITGNSPPIQALKKQISIAAPTDAWILITGENGTGKELVARTIHQMSDRADKPLIDVNCAAIPDELIESELFGHEKGAFTGATKRKRGKFEVANGGTIFLDEIGDMSLKTQAKILRILQEQKFERVGGTRTLTVDVRVVAASNKDLEKEIEKGTFREDLYYRLNVIPIEVPPLRNRIEDIPLLIEIFLKEFSEERHCHPKTMTPKAIEHLKAYRWPGNVREIKNLVERLAIMTESEVIDVKDLPPSYRCQKSTTLDLDFMNLNSLKEAKKQFEKAYIFKKLSENDNNISQTADSIGIERSHLHKKIKSYGLRL
ncbi:MAG: sigma-54-dependent Fis family transcriptional regulator [Deltaproteobacteria bacterium]|nr:sigma-54-dependent Fis family transcriptional regulator [Deltaproteobacteria bacterium]MBW2019392.1 sigma-54-dependent Fis family transcriptional regulator [Deltaproteobacteria bacterium]MBW2074229.1 sigma-54-dependent Fis family transcriptional regulator [Deltaproteobacteria bacterium]RLB83909.1 MAG: sigma-54-dependent Fis family transcriptional regulator [Deltaproteobacteria bacterium]